VGSTIHGVAPYGIAVDQTPAEVMNLIEGGGLVEFTCNGDAAYISADAPITAVTPRHVEGTAGRED
jgi:hypothetical protein